MFPKSVFGSVLVRLIHMFIDLDTASSFTVKILLLFTKLAIFFHPAFFLEVQVGLLLQRDRVEKNLYSG